MPALWFGDFRIIAETANHTESPKNVVRQRCAFVFEILPKTSIADEKRVSIRCPVCESNEMSVVDERESPEGRLTNVQCVRSGHVYLNPRASEQVYEQFYREGFGERFNAIDVHANHQALTHAAQPKTDRLMRFLAPDVPSGLDVFEIGSGYGNLLAALRDRHGARVTGIEPDPMGSIVARSVTPIAMV